VANRRHLHLNRTGGDGVIDAMGASAYVLLMPKHHAPTTGPSQRMLRVGELVRHALSTIFARAEVEDDALAGAVITVPEVRMTPDLKLANAYVMPLGGERATQVVEALNRHRKFIRGRIAPALGLKYAPDIKFYVDDTFDEASRIDSLLRSERVQRDLLDGEDGLE
jgi:ribosome-binding factor A